MISVPNVQDVSLEQLALRQNASLFEDVFGLQVQLRALTRRGRIDKHERRHVESGTSTAN